MAGDDIERRLTSVEAAVEQLRAQQQLTASDAGAARVLAAGADRDVSEVRSELRAHTSALNALRETQVEQGHRLDRIDGRLDGIDGRLDSIDGRLDSIDGRLDSIESTMAHGFATMQAGMTVIVDLLGTLSPPDQDGRPDGDRT